MTKEKKIINAIIKILGVSFYFLILLMLGVLVIMLLAVSSILNTSQTTLYSAFFLFLAIIMGNWVYDLIKDFYKKSKKLILTKELILTKDKPQEKA